MARHPGREGAVVVDGLTVRYPDGPVDALSDVTFTVAAGEIVGIVGANGAGKTTLCRAVTGIVPQLLPAHMSGRVLLAARDPWLTPVHQLVTAVGVGLDEPAAQFSQATAAEEVAVALESVGMAPAAMRHRIAGLLDRLGLEGLGDRPPETLSGGQQQRLLIAAALAASPPVLVLDEVTAGLDEEGREDVCRLLRELARTDGTAVLVVEHDTAMLAEHADRVLLLEAGRLVVDGSPAEVLGDVAVLGRAGVRAPDVTEVAAAVAPHAAEPRPVTLPAAIAWLEGRT